MFFIPTDREKSDLAVFSNGNLLIYGLGVALSLLLCVGLVTMLMLNSQTNSYNRFMEAGELLNKLNTARLNELIFTRDKTSSSALKVIEITKEIAHKTILLKDELSNDVLKTQLQEVVLALKLYNQHFTDYVNFKGKSQSAKKTMVSAAIRSSQSTDGLQKLQEKYIRLDTARIIGFRYQLENILENTVGAYEIVVNAGQAQEHLYQYRLSKDSNQLKMAQSKILEINNIIHRYREGIYNEKSQQLLKKLIYSKQKLLLVFDSFNSDKLEGVALNINNEVVKKLEFRIINIEDNALALHANEKSLLTDIQRKIRKTQELLSQRIALSEEVTQILLGVNIARQIDRDYFLSITKEARSIHEEQVLTLLSHTKNQVQKIQALLIEEDEKQVFSSVLPDINRYLLSFNRAAKITSAEFVIQSDMIKAALAGNVLLQLFRKSRIEDIEQTKYWAKTLIPLAFLFIIVLLILAILMKKYQSSLVDVTRLMRKSKEQAETADAAKSFFLATMSHEIRTPMNGVIGMIDLLSESNLNSDQTKIVSTVKGSALSLLRIINDVLDFSKIEAGKFEIEHTPYLLYDVIENVMRTLRLSAKEKGLKFNFFINSDVPNKVIGDQLRLGQILFNLLGNAIKFTSNQKSEKGKVSLVVELHKAEDENQFMLKLLISDNGIGISSVALKKLFEPFNQAEASTTRRFGGTGLGLSICKKLVDIMSGSLGVESIEGEGSTFTVILPIHLAKADSFITKEPNLLGIRSVLLSTDNDIHKCVNTYIMSRGGTCTYVQVEEDLISILHDANEEAAPFHVLLFGPDISAVLISHLISMSVKKHNTLKFILLGEQGLHKKFKSDELHGFISINPLNRSDCINAIGVCCDRVDIEVSSLVEKVNNLNYVPATSNEALAHKEVIMVVEDNITNQDVIRRQLDFLGYASDIFSNGELGLSGWKTGRYTLILTDCHMPEMDGYEMTKSIRKLEALSSVSIRIPIIAITANVLHGEQRKCIDAGMDYYLSKPIDKNKLRVVLKEWLPADIRVDNDATKLSKQSEGKMSNAVLETLDLTYLKETFGDEQQVVSEILSEFKIYSASTYEELELAFRDDNYIALKDTAHKLKSSVKAIGAQNLFELAEKLELACASEQIHLIANLYKAIMLERAKVECYICTL